MRFYVNVATQYDNRRPLLRQSTILLPWDTRRVLRVGVEIIYEKQFLTKLNLLQEYMLYQGARIIRKTLVVASIVCSFVHELLGCLRLGTLIYNF